MTLRQSLLLAIAIVLAAMTGAFAQFGFSDKPPCYDDFTQLRDEAQNRANAVRVSQQRKTPVTEGCRLITRFVEAEAKMVKFAEDNGPWCGIPAELVKQMNETHAKSQELLKRVCGMTPPKAKRIRIAAFSSILEFESSR